ncbi:hypothetical protein [endosymbiont 'TC1' of Trimyema compressum]|uniref:hypothetical protein n=1 Tax=endosymbiont 'TC1' of Trimyema compressum TaxID=243899 RepID=UPI001FDF4602|nr:hypothetical protein [endosymbiont 'TC1' of Trimyema compressum]
MANRLNGRKKILIPSTLSVDAKSLITNYTGSAHDANVLDIVEVNCNEKTGGNGFRGFREKTDC